MPSSKGKPTDPELREKIKEDIQAEPTSKDGSGKGGWAAWKAAKLSKEYEAQGGGYENAPGTKNEPKKGTPEPKGENKKEKETNDAAKSDEKAPEEASKDAKEKKGAAGKKGAAAEKKEVEKKDDDKKGRGRPTGKAAGTKKEKKEPAVGMRRSERVSKREAEGKDEVTSKKQKK